MPVGGSYFDRAVLLDTGAVIALADPADPYRPDAQECARRIAAAHLPLYVALPTIIESQRQILFRRGRNEARALVESIYDGSLNLVEHTGADEASARAILARFNWLDLSMADALNAAAMSRVGIRVAFTFDDDYLRLGFLRVPPFYDWW